MMQLPPMAEPEASFEQAYNAVQDPVQRAVAFNNIDNAAPPAFDPMNIQQNYAPSYPIERGKSVPHPSIAPAFPVPPVMNNSMSLPVHKVQSHYNYEDNKPPPDLPFPSHPEPSMQSMSNKFRQKG